MFVLVSGAQAGRAAPLQELEISKTASADPANVGSRLTYTVTVRNLGKEPKTVVGLDSLPKEVTFVSATASQGGACGRNDRGLVQCPLGTIPAGGQATFTVVVTVTQRPASGTITNLCTAFATDRSEAHCQLQTRVVEEPRECRCTGLDVIARNVRVGSPRWAMHLRWTLTCKGDVGRSCQGTIGDFKWSGRPLWLGSASLIEVTSPRPPKAKKGQTPNPVVVRCNGKCRTRPTTGTTRIAGVAKGGRFQPRVRANQLATFSFNSYCDGKRVGRFRIAIQFGPSGRLDLKRSDLNGNGKPDGKE